MERREVVDRGPGLALGVLVALVACSGEPARRAHDEVIAAALQKEMVFLRGDAPGREDLVFCVGTSDAVGEREGREALARLNDTGHSAVAAAECGVEGTDVRHRATGRPAVLLTVGSLTWKRADEADVVIGVIRRRGEAIRRRYRVVKEAGRWLCLGQVLELSPA